MGKDIRYHNGDTSETYPMMLAVDVEFVRAAEAAGLDPTDIFSQPEPEAAGYNVAIIYDGAFDNEATVFASYNAADVARAIVESEQDPALEVLITHHHIGPDYSEASGYGPYGRFRWDDEAEEVDES